MLEKLKVLFNKEELLSGNYGIEREGIRVDKNGNLASTMHPSVFGDKVKNKYITTDFSESQVEVITPVFNTTEEVYNFTNTLYDITCGEIKDEYIWPQSMPCVIRNEEEIRVSKYNEDEDGKKAQVYREKLLKKYGGLKQLISGIHYNFSFTNDFMETLYLNSDKKTSFKEFKNNIYLKLSRNYLRYRWLIVYLLGASPKLHKTYIDKCREEMKKKKKKCTNVCDNNALSYRNSECGYTNKLDLFPDYSSVEGYVKSLKSFINEGIIESAKELYSSIRLKTKDTKDLLEALSKDGIEYLEYRSIDINPFERGGVSLNDLHFLQLFNLYLLIKEEDEYANWQEESLSNFYLLGKDGLKDIEILKSGSAVSKEKWAIEILEEIKDINEKLNLGKDNIISEMICKVKDPSLTHAYKLNKIIEDEGYVEAHINLASGYKKEAYNNRFKMQGYEDLELSTQILMKEAIKRGIEVKIVDRAENFISLNNGQKIEYVKQATKTSKDNYVSVLIMENKSVTKKVLEKSNIRVPKGSEFNSLEEAKSKAEKYENKAIVIKPKSTNFGTGISIFKDGSSKENIIKAFEIAFKYDNTVLVEEFIEGKEYRFLVINDKVQGILHRVPANVKGDGTKSISELVKIKNKDPLRGRHYVTPLEKIDLDENAKLFLENDDKTFDYVPKKDEVVYLRENSNISTGGDSIDYTDDIPQKFKDIAVKCAKAVSAQICGVDMMLKDYSDENSEYGIIELNFNPAIHIHSYPYKGKERKIAVEILKLLKLI